MPNVREGQEIRAILAKLALALQSGDVLAYRQIADGPDPFQEELFLRKSLKMRERGLSLQVRDIAEDSEGVQALVDWVDAAGSVRDQSWIKLVQQSVGWFVDEL